jgi:serine protease Do
MRVSVGAIPGFLLLLAQPSVAIAQAQPLPASTETRPVQLTRLIAKLNYGDPIGKLKAGFLCVPHETIRFEPKSQADYGTEEFQQVFRAKIEQLGFKVAGDPNALFPDAEDEPSEFLVGGTINKLFMDVCFPWASLGNTKASRGSAQVEVTWQIFSVVDRKVIATIPTKGTYQEKSSRSGGLYGIALAAFAETVEQLVASDAFRSAFVGRPKGVATTIAPASNLTPLILSASTAAPKTLADAIGSTVLIFSGGGHGSGFLVSDDGYLLTNAHVAGSARLMKVRWPDGVETEAEVIRVDKARDVALLKTVARGRPLRMRSTPVAIGEDVFAIGAPLDAKLQSSVTKGIVSATRVIQGLSYIQSDVSTNPGNSGGPLLDRDQNVIGLTVSGFEKDGVPLGVNLFIPIEAAREFLGLQLPPSARRL